jgi:hypothetical protein
MRLDDMIPYERNAWDNAAGVPAIAESIREFGFRGKIKLRSRENPVIVSGHHRVMALKSLGWDELPDEHIEFCDDLTDDEVTAFRLADNKTGQGGRWNRALEREEVRRLAGKVDMSRFNFDFKSKARPYGAERLKTDDAYNLREVNASHCEGPLDMPAIEPVDFKPTALLPFNYAKTATDKAQTLHFFIDDYQFERLWASPSRYLDLVLSFEAALTPDFSLYMDMPLPMQRWNEYRRRALGNYWQRHGAVVVPTLSWSDERSYGFCFDGLPCRSTVAVSTVGVKVSDAALAAWRAGMAEAMRRLEPARILVYGGLVDFDFGAAEVVSFAANAAFRKG